MYQREKEKIAQQLFTSLSDTSTLVLADWLKVRATFKTWYKVWVELRPGLLVLYKTPKIKRNGQWIGTVLLSLCQVIERPSRKDGYCFKLFNALEQNIWASRGPKGESYGAITMPLPLTSLMFRTKSISSGSQWIQAMRLNLRCSKRVILFDRKTERSRFKADETNSSGDQASASSEGEPDNPITLPDDFGSDELIERTESYRFVFNEKGHLRPFAKENKSIFWALFRSSLRNVDLSKVTLPTFILEPRSFLQKLSDYYYHCDLLYEANTLECPYERLKCVVRWYLSGFYKKPAGLKKPYNPVLGEYYRCAFQTKTGSRMYFLAEQISHHPPKSAFYALNPIDGYESSGTVCVSSKIGLTSVSAVLQGEVYLRLLNRNETYVMSLPSAVCTAQIKAGLAFDIDGRVEIQCLQSGYSCDLIFRTKSLFAGEMHSVSGEIRGHGRKMATITGRWDRLLVLTDLTTKASLPFWEVNKQTVQNRLKLYEIPTDRQEVMESERLWADVTKAIDSSNQDAATQAKFQLEEAQRQNAKQLRDNDQQHSPRFFHLCPQTHNWTYKQQSSARSFAEKCAKHPPRPRPAVESYNTSETSKKDWKYLPSDSQTAYILQEMRAFLNCQEELQFQFKNHEQKLYELICRQCRITIKDFLLFLLLIVIVQVLIIKINNIY